MLTTLEDDKAELLTRAADAARHSKGTGGPDHDQVEDLLTAYYRHVAAEDLVERGPEDIYGALASHHRLAQTRPQGTAAVRVFTPGLADPAGRPPATRWSRSSPTTCRSSSTR